MHKIFCKQELLELQIFWLIFCFLFFDSFLLLLFLHSPPAIERLSNGLFQEVIVTNTIPVAEKNYFPQLTVLSVANLLGETIWRVHDDSSVSSIFQWNQIRMIGHFLQNLYHSTLISPSNLLFLLVLYRSFLRFLFKYIYIYNIFIFFFLFFIIEIKNLVQWAYGIRERLWKSYKLGLM